MQSAPQPNSDATATANPEALIAAAVAQLTALYHAKGDLELSFVRQIAGAQFTIDSLERTVLKLSAAGELDAVTIDRLTRIQARKQRMLAVALKELKGLQSLRNAILQYPDQTENMPPLADQMPFIGYPPKIRPIPTAILAKAAQMKAAKAAANAATVASTTSAATPAPPSATGEMRLPRGFEHFPNKEVFLKAREENAPRR